MIWRIALTAVLVIVAFVAGAMGVFSPMLADDPRNAGVAVIAFRVCAAVVLASGLGILATWWRW